MKSENLIEKEECNTIGLTPQKNEERILPGTIIRNPVNGKIISIVKLTTEEFIQRAIKIHKIKYNYSNVNYTGMTNKIEIICPLHGLFWQSPSVHLQGADCLKCGYDKTHSSTKYSTDEWIQKANKKHYSKYNYSTSNYINSYTKIIIICPHHGEFKQTPDSHIQGRGCPNCNFSKAEQHIERWLISNNIKYIPQKTFDDCKNPKTNYKLRYDFYIPSKNLLIEYDGEQHFKEMTTGKYIITALQLKDNNYRDDLKTNYAKMKNINLLRISYSEKNNMDDILSKSLF